MKRTLIAIAALTLTLALGCKNQSTATATTPASDTNATSVAGSTTLTPEQLGELGAQINKSPNDAAGILSAQGLTEQSFEQQIRQVAQDPAASRRYAAAYKRASA
jgi:hypothetical protein